MTRSTALLRPTTVLPAVALLALFVGAGAVVAGAQDTPTDNDLRLLKGVARPVRSVTLGAPVDGTLRTVTVEEGEAVAADAVVATMDDRVQQQVVNAARVRADSTARVDAANASLNVARIALERRESLGNSVSPDELEEARAEHARALADVAAAGDQTAIDAATLVLEEARLEQHNIRSPFDGIVERRVVEPGSALRQTDEVLVLVDVSTLEVELFIPARFGPPTRGASYELHAGAPVNETLTATCTYVSPVLETQSQAFRATFEIPNAEGGLVAGFQAWPASLTPVDAGVVAAGG